MGKMEYCSSYDFITREEELFFLTQSLVIVPAALEDLLYDHDQLLSVDDYRLLDGVSFMDTQVPTLPSVINDFLPDDCFPNPTAELQENVTSGEYAGDQFGIMWNEFSNNFATDELNLTRELVVHCPNISDLENNSELNLENQIGNDRKANEEQIDDCGSHNMLTKEKLSQYFYMPILQAAKEVNMGLTLLKKKCRELGIRRWPHRKLMSMQKLIKNVQEMEKDEVGGVHEENIRCSIDILEQEKRLIEAIPDIEFKDNTKRLRQACFKANYKKRKLNEMDFFIDYNNSSSSCSTISTTATNASNVECEGSVDDYGVMFDEEAEQLRSLLYDSDQSFSSSDHTLPF